MHTHRRSRKIRRAGRHTTPSQVEKAAEKAGRAAPAMAIAGALVATAPQAHAVEGTPAKAATVTVLDASTGSSSGYVNPIGAGLVHERVDQGVDFTGSGSLYALGSGTVVNVYNSGWPGGVFLGIHLDAGQYVYYAEDITAAVGVGQRVTAGQYIGRANGGGSGIELGWAAPPGNGDSAAHAAGQYAYPTSEGASFNALLASLGGTRASQVRARSGPAARQSTGTASAKTSPQDYVIRPGDTLSGIAQKLCGAAGDWADVWHANPQITDPDLIYAGYQLTVACSGGQGAGLPAAAASSGPSSDGASDGDDGSSLASASPSSSPSSGSSASSSGGGSYVNPASYSGFQACVISRESGGNSQVMNSTGHYGLYQFSAATWAAAGGNPNDFGHASVAEQNQAFAQAYAAFGTSPWAPYDGC
jgi:nucleoid-associated protein YgaU